MLDVCPVMSIDRHLRRSAGLVWVKLVWNLCGIACNVASTNLWIHQDLHYSFKFQILRQQPKKIQRDSEKKGVQYFTQCLFKSKHSISSPLVAWCSCTCSVYKYIYMCVHDYTSSTNTMYTCIWTIYVEILFVYTTRPIPSQGHERALQNPVSSKSRSSTWPCRCKDLEGPVEIFQKPRR